MNNFLYALELLLGARDIGVNYLCYFACVLIKCVLSVLIFYGTKILCATFKSVFECLMV